MRYLAKVLFNKDTCSNSQAAKQHVFKLMQTDLIKNVVGDCYDAFYIGGSWSGILTTDLLDQEKLYEFASNYEKESGSSLLRTLATLSLNQSDIERISLAEKMFHQYFPDFCGEFPFFRYEFNELGYEDDAAIIENERMYYRWVGDFEGHSHESDFNGFYFIDLDHSKVSPKNTINKKWVVIVSCHN